MKKKILLLFIVLLQALYGRSQNTETQKLVTTCKVWGFLKYYHPMVAVGKINWDEKLFEVLPKIEKTQTKEEFSAVIEKWIDDLGEVPVNKPLPTDSKRDFFDKNLDLEWTQKNKLFSKNLSKKLKFITENRLQGVNHYVNYEGKEIALQFTNEPLYTDFKWTDKNLRLLILFRYWNYVEYFFPYKYVMDQKWDKSLTEILPHFTAPSSEKDFLLAMRELTVKLNDTHASTFNMQMMQYLGGEKYITASTKVVNDKIVFSALINDSLAKIDDIKVGDIVTKVDGIPVVQKLKELLKYLEGSNEAASLQNRGFVMFTGNTDDVEIEFIRDNTVAVKKIHRYPNEAIKRAPPKVAPQWEILENNIGYVKMNKVSKEEVPKMMEKLKNTQAIIFDVRNRPIYTDFLVSEYLNPEPKPILRLLRPDLSYPGRYFFANEMQECGKINPDYYKGKVIVLVGSGTMSFGEQTVMSLQTAPNTTVIGSQTAGADGPNYYFTIIKGFESSFTSAGVFYPNKKETQRIGIPVDVVVAPTITGIQQGKDEILERAILFIRKGV